MRRSLAAAAARVVDMRSDTVTLPCAGMRQAMAAAEVGDDVMGGDPSINALEARLAAMSGKPAALYVPSGTMSNLLAIMVHCNDRGSEIILGDKAHMHVYEQGHTAQLAGVHSKTVPTQPDGKLRLEDIENAVRGDDPHYPISKVVCLENTQNLMGGVPVPPSHHAEVAEVARRHGLRVHVDGARIWNTMAALDLSLAELCADVDSMSICMSKGMGAPVGSVLVGTEELVGKARRYRKALGGGMRQAGILAAGADYAIDHNLPKLPQDHANAKALAAGLESLGFARAAPADPGMMTNIFYFRLPEESRWGGDAAKFAEDLEESGVLIGGGYGDGTVCRAACNVGVSAEDISYALDRVAALMRA
mmetsp:Transcript_23233/g.72548  ORF Transcript_23233/g.72548 Transcript_23233/m.72548 type:complete len:363 (-) Transcript_23233:54-1142(-)